MEPSASISSASQHRDQPTGFGLSPDDRIGPRPPSRLGRRLATGGIVVALAGAAGWFAWTEPERAALVWLSVIGTVGSLAASLQAPEAPKPPSPTPVAGVPSPESLAPASLPPLSEPAPAASSLPLRTGSLAAPEPTAVAKAPIPYEEPVAEPPSAAADRHRRRAIAAGLHPDLSAELFERLSEADYRNAAIAIARALAETPDTGVLTWPARQKPGQAQFEIRFVPGAEAGCRRYVVAIAKGGWQTTAPALDRCTARRTAVKRG